MGLKDFFSGGSRTQSRIDKLIKTVTNKYTQSPERYAAMQSLLDDGSEPALVGVMRRFTIVSSKSIEDEEEKGWAYRELSGLGAKVLPAVKRFCLEYENVAWALRIVEDVADETQEWDILDALLEAHPPGYERDASKKKQLLTHLAEIEDQHVPGLLAGYLEDHDEDVRFMVVEKLDDIAEESTKEALVRRLCNPQEDSLRIRVKVLDTLARHGWDVSAWTAELAKNIGHEHSLQKGKVVRR